MRLVEEKSTFPDLLVVDGGKGQANAAFEVLKEMNLPDIPVGSNVRLLFRGTLRNSAAGSVEVCQVVDPLKTIRFVFPKWILEKYR